MSGELRVYVQDHVFLVADHDVAIPFDTMDHSTGIAGVMESAALVSAGVDRGYVTVTIEALEHDAPLDTVDQWAALEDWEDVAEFSLFAPHGTLTVGQLEYPPHDIPELPSLSPHGPGHYRLRIHAAGRDKHFDQVVDAPGERFHILTWPAPPAPPLVIKATSRAGYGLRLAGLSNPPPTTPVAQPSDQQAKAEHEALLRRNLLSE
ncbi:hypothetical protein KBX50_30345 [Micromonospora sp. C51]|uniref:hypothetical protein n=1 Tax=Micromonospora sp. C51 TaxID=2824879 RepID=UPI001B392B1F|nr:hypothetical protein [Micromonospora sp. C51]MBQ1052743.1 hypothetical protein [Micromonospora sp. C51]